MGGGTLDISIIEFGEGVTEVLSTYGDSTLGGDDYTQRLYEYVISEVRKKHPSFEVERVQATLLKEVVENAKKDLSSMNNVTINIPSFIKTEKSYEDLRIEITRDLFEKITKDLTQKISPAIKKVLEEAKLGPSDIDDSLLLGGSSRMPMIKNIVTQELKKAPFTGIDPVTCVAQGAALRASIKDGLQTAQGLLLLDALPGSYGIGMHGDEYSIIIEKNTTIPVSKTVEFTTTEDNQSSLRVPIYRGDKSKASDNQVVSVLELNNIVPAPKGSPKIEVTFDIDPDMIMNVRIKDVGSGNQAKATITSPYRLNPVQIKVIKDKIAAWRMKRDEIN